MKFIDLCKTASASMRHSKARTTLTILAIFIGAMTITLTNGLGTGIKGYLHKQVGNLGAANVINIKLSSPSGSGNSSDAPDVYKPSQKISPHGVELSPEDVRVIQAIPHISNVEPVYGNPISPDYIKAKTGKYQLIVSQQFGPDTADMVAGKGVNNASGQDEVTVPASYVSSLGYSNAQSIIGKPVTIGISNAEGIQSTTSATVVGVQQKTLLGSAAVDTNTSFATQLHTIQSIGLPAATANAFTTAVATFPSNLTASQIATLKSTLTAKGYNGQTTKDQANTVFEVLNVVTIVLDAFGAIALLAASFGIINTLYMAVQERSKEIGLMKALGMSRSKIFTLFSIEAILIGFWGSALGVAFAMLVGKLINTIAANGLLKGIPGLTLLTFPITTVVSVMLGIMLLAFLAGTLPALRASRKDPIEALRYE